MERLQKVIAGSGIASRRKAEEMIREGRVSVNGKVVTEMGTQVSGSDTILVDGKEIRREEKVYYLLNKPSRTICAVSDDRDRRTVIDCLEGVEARVFPVGRLDYDTTGLLILTNDGEFANKMMHPRYHLPKTYEVVVDGIFTDQMAKMLTRGIELEDGKTLPADVLIRDRSNRKNRSELEITIYEGKNREIRRMMEYFHLEVRSLNRIRFGYLELKNLRRGEFRRLRMYEVKKLISMSETGNQSSPKE